MNLSKFILPRLIKKIKRGVIIMANTMVLKTQLEESIGLDGYEDGITNLEGSKFFWNLLISNFQNDNNEEYKWSKPLSKERLEKFKEVPKQVLGQNGKVILYRSAGKLFINKLFNDGWRGKKIYG
jgi:hypothetical protein